MAAIVRLQKTTHENIVLNEILRRHSVVDKYSLLSYETRKTL
jgi:hypothetical protein